MDFQMICNVKALYSRVATTFAVRDNHTSPIPILQGDLMLPILFNICMDPLLCKLDELMTGYKIDGQRCGAMSFTDDLTDCSDSC